MYLHTKMFEDLLQKSPNLLVFSLNDWSKVGLKIKDNELKICTVSNLLLGIAFLSILKESLVQFIGIIWHADLTSKV